jgi:outer membrane receptor protein involved in Fe transport
MYVSFLVVLLSLPVASAEINQGSVSGRVIDIATKHPIPDASVTIYGTNVGTVTDEDGRFNLAGMNEGLYKLEFGHIAYHRLLETDVRVVRNKTTSVEEIELAPAIMMAAQVTVSTTPFQENPQAPVSHFTYTREEIRRTPGATGDVFRAMETLPGVSTSGGEFSAFSVRGNSPTENIILIDNIPFDKVSHFDGGSSEEQEKQGGRFSIFAPNLIEEARFQAGGFSAAYGGKLASFLDLKLREANQEDVTLDARFDVTGWEANYDGPVSLVPATGVIFSARHTNFTRILELTGQDEFGRPRFTDLIFKTTTDLNSRHKISVLGIHAPEKFDQETEHVFKSDDFAARDLVDFDEAKSLLGLNWRYLAGTSSVLQASVYGRRTDRRARLGAADPIPGIAADVRSVNDFEQRLRIGEDLDEIEVGTRTTFTHAMARGNQLTVGLEGSRSRYDRTVLQNGLDTLYVFDGDDFRVGPEQRFIVTAPDQIDSRFDGTRSLFATFAEWSLTPVPRLTVNAGARYEYNQLNDRNYISPRLSSSFRLSERTRLNVATGVYYQTPDLDVASAASQNEALANERALHLITGVSHYLSDDVKLTSEVYVKQFDDLIVHPDRTNQVHTNAGEGWARGVDFSLIKRLVDQFYGQINYSLSKSRRDDDDGLESYDSDFNQPHIFSVLGGYEINKSWAISAKWRYATGRPRDSSIVHEDVFDNPDHARFSQQIIANNADRLPAFHTFNIRVDHRTQLGRFALVGFLDIVNVYDHLNVNEQRFQPLTGTIDERGFGVLPTIGLKLEL